MGVKKWLAVREKSILYSIKTNYEAVQYRNFILERRLKGLRSAEALSPVTTVNLK